MLPLGNSIGFTDIKDGLPNIRSLTSSSNARQSSFHLEICSIKGSLPQKIAATNPLGPKQIFHAILLPIRRELNEQ